MASNIVEFFGYDPSDRTAAAIHARANRQCGFSGTACVKTLNDGQVSGVCTLKPKTSGPVICCPIRLYANQYAILADVALAAFGVPMPLVAANVAAPQGQEYVAVFGKGWGKELRLPNRGKSGGYFVDWVLARVNNVGELVDFVIVEVQSIDTTGNYRGERAAYLADLPFQGASTAGFNWENVNKRILPQLIYKGHVLRQEQLCQKGLFFICPTPVYHKITERLGGRLRSYPLQPGALTFMWYDVGPTAEYGAQRTLLPGGQLTTTVDQLALAFTAPSNLPPSLVYEHAIRLGLSAPD